MKSSPTHEPQGHCPRGIATSRTRTPLSPRRSAFTLLELVFVVFIIAVLAAIAVPAYRKAREMADLKSCYEQQRRINSAVAQYNLDNNKSDSDLAVLFPLLVAGNYLTALPKDPGAQGTGPSHANYSYDTSKKMTCSTHGSVYD